MACEVRDIQIGSKERAAWLMPNTRSVTRGYMKERQRKKMLLDVETVHGDQLRWDYHMQYRRSFNNVKFNNV